ncbi:ATP-dependent DNA helicase pfh1 [Linum perenne]
MGAKLFTAAITAFGAYSKTSTSSCWSSRSVSTRAKAVRKPRNVGPKKLAPSVSVSTSDEKEKKGDVLNGVEWGDEQEQVLAQVRRGSSVFITGSAGSGKTLLLKQIISILKEVHGHNNVFVTASTGVAACAIRGQTVHSFAGIGIGKIGQKALVDRVSMNKSATKRWKLVKALVIDEVGMVDAEMFENLELVARKVKGSKKVWGGIQLVVSGDFFQMPPITMNQHGKEFAFEADCWDTSFDIQVELKRIFRQSDPKLIKLLQGMRKGKSDVEDLEVLKQSCLMNEPDPSVLRLYPRIDDVKRVNSERMSSLREKIYTYIAMDGGLDSFKRQLNQGMAPEQLEICLGARVMLIKNLDTVRQLCNGATGTVAGFSSANQNGDRYPLVKFDSGIHMIMEPEKWEIMEGGKTVAWRKQVPLILAWALSIHKCQGMTLDGLHTDLSRAFGYGMVYVALSRVRSLEGLSLSGFGPSKIRAHPKVVAFYDRLASNKLVNDEEADKSAKNLIAE